MPTLFNGSLISSVFICSSERSLARCNRQHLTRVSAKLVCVKNPHHRVLELLPSHCRFRTAGYKTKKLLVFFSCAIDLTANSTLAALVTLPREGVCLFWYEFSISRIIFFCDLLLMLWFCIPILSELLLQGIVICNKDNVEACIELSRLNKQLKNTAIGLGIIVMDALLTAFWCCYIICCNLPNICNIWVSYHPFESK